MDYTLDRLIDELRNPQVRRRRSAEERAPCPCGRNPLLAYFQTAEQAIIESLFVFTEGLDAIAPDDRSTSLEAVKLAIRVIGRREIESFCAVCQHTCGTACAPKTTSIGLSAAVPAVAQ